MYPKKLEKLELCSYQIKGESYSLQAFTAGKGIPIVILHGAMLDHSMMEACMEPIFEKVAGYQRFYLDLPGMGETEASIASASSDQILELLCEFIKDHIPNESFVLAGESYGGYLARGLLKDFSDRIRGMLLLCPVVEPVKSKRRVPEHHVLEHYFANDLDMEQPMNQMYSNMFVIQNSYTYERFLAEIYPGIQKTDNMFLNQLQKKGYTFTFPLPDTQKKFLFPVLLFAGRQDSCVGYLDALELANSYEHSTVMIADRAGHNLQIEQSVLFTQTAELFFIELTKKRQTESPHI